MNENQKLIWSQLPNTFNADVCSKFIKNTKRGFGAKNPKAY